MSKLVTGLPLFPSDITERIRINTMKDRSFNLQGCCHEFTISSNITFIILKERQVMVIFWGNHGWGMGPGWVFMVLFWVLVILGIIYLIQLISRGSKREETETALDILKKRYARGEITEEEFEKIRDNLTKT